LSNQIIFFLYSLILIVSAFFFGHEFGMSEGAKYQREIDSQKLIAFNYDANKKLTTCHRVLGKQ